MSARAGSFSAARKWSFSPPAGRLASRRASDPPPGGAWRGSKRARSARGRCRFRNRNIPMVGGAGFSRCRKNPLVFRPSARRGGHGVQFFFLFSSPCFLPLPGFFFLRGSLPLQDSSLSIDERARTCFVAGSTKNQKSLCYRVLCKNKNKKQTCHVIRARRLAMEPLNCLVYSSRRDDFLDYFCQKRSPLVVQFRVPHSSKKL